jgi:hypothetical protein
VAETQVKVVVVAVVARSLSPMEEEDRSLHPDILSMVGTILPKFITFSEFQEILGKGPPGTETT